MANGKWQIADSKWQICECHSTADRQFRFRDGENLREACSAAAAHEALLEFGGDVFDLGDLAVLDVGGD